MTVLVSELANGLRVVSAHMPAVETVSLGVWVNAGTRHETEAINGASHFLEHMAFKGTRRRSARAIAEEIEAVGGYLNAYTSREFTVYYATVLAGDEALALDIIGDILQHSAFDGEEIERERAVILQEIGQADDAPDELVFDRFQEAAYRGQPMGRPVLGTPERIAGLPRAALIDYLSRNYTAPRMVAAAAGKIDHRAFAAHVRAAFEDLSAAEETAPAPARYTGGRWCEERSLAQAHIVVGLEGCGYRDPDQYASSVLSTILGGGMSSRLFQDIREKRGLAYDVHSFGATFIDGGTFGVYAGTGAEDAVELLERIAGHIRGMDRGVTEAELRRARAQLKAGAVMSLEGTAARSEQLARQVLIYGRPIETAEIAARIDAVDIGALARVSERLRAGRPTLAAVGPVGGLPDPGALDVNG